MKFSFHYLTLEPNKIIKQIEYKEKRAVEEHLMALEWRKAITEIGLKNGTLPSPHFGELPDLEDALEQVVVKNWGNIISVYPITVTPYQENSLTWLASKYDSRKNSITQKYGNIIAYWEKERLRFGYSIKGNVVSEKEISIDNSLIGSGEYTLQKYAPQDMLQAVLQSDVSKQTEGLNLDIPLILPTTWKDLWTVYMQTQFTTFCQ